MSNKEKIKIIFAGTPDFAIPSFQSLINENNFEILAVITQPDKKQGRKQILSPTPVKITAENYKIAVWQPEKIKEYEKEIIKANPDLGVVIAYGQIIPQDILDIPRYGWINIHASLLPKYRGAACVQAAILAGDQETGITIMKIDKGLDTGPILKQTKIKINKEDTAETLSDKLAKLGAEIIVETLKNYISGKIKPKNQSNSESTYVPTLSKADGKIDWQKNAEEIERMTRALNPWPGTWTELNGKKIKIISAFPNILKINKYKIGETFLSDGKLAVQCGQNALLIKRLQLEGKKETTAEEFLRGHKENIGQIFN
ncbi:MAG: methionyl-tRNA formyltransferase [Patescibacteria group bacterium]